MKLELFRSNYFGSKSSSIYSTCIGINKRFRGRNLYIFRRPTIKLKLEMWEIGFIVFLNVHEKITFNYSDSQGLSYSWCACIRILHINSVLPFRQRKLCIFKQQSKIFGPKSAFTLNCDFLQTLIPTEETREPIISVYMVFHRCSLFFYWQQGTFRTTLIVHSTKKFHGTCWCSSGIACQVKQRIGY